MIASDLVAAKIVVAALLCLSSFCGLVAPNLLLSKISWDPSLVDGVLGVSNCLSAGLLVGAGMLHFFVAALDSSMEAAGAAQGANNTAQAAELHRSGQALLPVSLFIFGIYLPLFFDRVLLPRLRGAGKSAYGHTHGVDVHPELADGEQQQHGSRVILLLVILTLHSAFEGAALGSERSFSSLKAIILPMLVHKFFDGFILGIAAARGQNVDPLFVANGKIKDSFPPRSMFAWLVVTPAAMIIVGSAIGDGEDSALMQLIPVIQAIGAGGFVYVALLDIVPMELSRKEMSSALRFFAIFAGTVIVWIIERHHNHE